MNAYKQIQSIQEAPEVMMGEIRLRQAIPTYGVEQISPFILLHHFNFTIAPGEDRFYVAPHPHRGFSPVTFMFEGFVEHNDSLGNKMVIGNNEVQWIDAGRGIIHSERADKDFVNKGGKYQGIQLWINTPAAHKMDPPSYQPITQKEIVVLGEDGVEFRLISGQYENTQGPAKSDVITAMISMDVNATQALNLPETNHSLIYILQGKLRINEIEIGSAIDLVVFEKGPGSISITALENTQLLLMSGQPIDEPLVTHGPFVMNNQTEILHAMRDYQDGKMGFLYA